MPAAMAGQLAERVVRVLELTEAPQSGRDEDGEAELPNLVAVDRFVAIGRAKEEMDWAGYRAWSHHNAAAEPAVRRVDEAGQLVFVERDERGDGDETIRTVTVFEFDPADRLRRIDMYR